MTYVPQRLEHVAQIVDELTWREAALRLSRSALIVAALYLFMASGLEAMGQGSAPL